MKLTELQSAMSAALTFDAQINKWRSFDGRLSVNGDCIHCLWLWGGSKIRAGVQLTISVCGLHDREIRGEYQTRTENDEWWTTKRPIHTPFPPEFVEFMDAHFKREE